MYLCKTLLNLICWIFSQLSNQNQHNGRIFFALLSRLLGLSSERFFNIDFYYVRNSLGERLFPVNTVLPLFNYNGEKPFKKSINGKWKRKYVVTDEQTKVNFLRRWRNDLFIISLLLIFFVLIHTYEIYGEKLKKKIAQKFRYF